MSIFTETSFEEPNHEHYFKCLQLKRRLDIIFKIVGIIVVVPCILLGAENFFVTFLGSFGGGGVVYGIIGSLAMLAAGGLTAYAFTEKSIKLCVLGVLLHLFCATMGFAFVSVLFAVLTMAMCACCKVYNALQNTEGYPYFSARQMEEEKKKHKEKLDERTLRLMRERDKQNDVGEDMPTINFSDIED